MVDVTAARGMHAPAAMRNVILYRAFDAEEAGEIEALLEMRHSPWRLPHGHPHVAGPFQPAYAGSGLFAGLFPRNVFVTPHRTDLAGGDLVVARYCALPFYRDLEADALHVGARLVNSYAEHRVAADLAEWYPLLEDETPETWFRFEDVPPACGPLFLKGETNSRRQLWRTHAYAETREAARDVMLRLAEDSLLSHQRTVFRRFVPLAPVVGRDGKRLLSVTGMPVSREFRFFVLRGRILCGGFYWSSFVDDIGGAVPTPGEIPAAWLERIVARLAPRIPFFAVDVALTALGAPIVVEVNDGQQAGLSCIPPGEFYRALAGALLMEEGR